MESFIKDIEKKLSVDNLVDMMKESKVIDEDTVKEEDVRKALDKIDPKALMEVDELVAKLNEISEEVSKDTSESSKDAESSKSRSKSALSKPSEETCSADNDVLRALNKDKNVFHLNEDFLNQLW